MALKTRECHECGAPFTPRQNGALFCGDPCRTAFHHRRRVRGAQLYDFMIAQARQTGKSTLVKEVIDKLLDAYLTSDRKRRAGRSSGQPIEYAIVNIPVVFGEDGDKR